MMESMTKIKAEQKLYSFIFWRDSIVFALRWVCFVLTFFMIEGVWATSTLSIRANQLGDLVMKALNPETGLVATSNISIFKNYFIDFADHYDERGENSVFAVDADLKNNSDGAISDSFDMDKLENEDIPRMHIPLGRERGAPKYCQFLGGRWSLDPSTPLKLNPKSKVEIMTPSGIRESIDSEQLTSMRLELLKR